MSAKEDHARNLELNRISKNYNEVSKKNTLLEAECVKMRASMKEMAEKHSTYMKQCNEKMEEMKRHFELEKERLNEETKKESSLQRAHHFESINDIKKQLESIYNEKYNQNKMEHMNLMQQLNKERDELKKEMEKHTLQMANERDNVISESEKTRKQMKKELDEFHARIKQDEQECAIRIVFEMDEEREKIKLQLTEEREKIKLQITQEHESIKRQVEDEIAGMKQQAKIEIDKKMQQIENDQKQLQEMKRIQDEESAKLQHEITQLKQREEEQNKRFCNEMIMINEERTQMKHQLDEERNQNRIDEHQRNVQFLTQMKDEREKMKSQMEKERQQNQTNLSNERQELENKFNARVAAHNTLVQRVKEQMDALTIEHSKVKELQHELKLEKERVAEQEKKAAEEFRISCEEALAEKKRENESLFKSTMNKYQAAHDDAIKKLNDKLNHEIDKVKGNDAVRENEHAQLLQKIKMDLVEKIKNNTDSFSKAKLDVETKYNTMMDEINKERQQIKEKELELNAVRKQLENDRDMLFKQAQVDAAEQRKSNSKVLDEAKLEQETRFNEMVNKQKSEFNAQLQKLNDEQKRLKQHENDLNALFSKRVEDFTIEIEQRRNKLFEQMQKNSENQQKANEEEFMKKTQEQETKFNAAMEALRKKKQEQETQFNAAMEEFNKKKQEQETQYNTAMSKKKQEQETQFNAVMEALNKKKQEQETQFNAAMDECNQTVENTKMTAQQKIEMLQRETEIQRKKCEEQYNKKKQELDERFNAAMKDMNDKITQSNQTVENTKKNTQQKIEMLQKEFEVQRNKIEEKFNEKKTQLEQHHTMENKKRQLMFDETIKQLNEEKIQVNLKLKSLTESLTKSLSQEYESYKEKILNEYKERQLALDEKTQQLDEEKIQVNLKLKSLTESLTQEYESYKEKIFNDYLIEKLNSESLVQKTLELCDEKRKLAESQTEKMQQLQYELAKEKTILKEERILMEKENARLEADKKMLAEKQNEFIEAEKSFNALTRSLMNDVEHLKHERQTLCTKITQDTDSLKQRSNTEKPISEHLHEAFLKNSAHLELIRSLNFKDKRVMIYSHYSESEELESYNWLTVESLEHYFDYVFILTNCQNEWNTSSLNHNKIYLLNYNMKSDFRNYGVFIMQTRHNLVNAACVALVNDSFVIVDVNSFGQCMKSVFETKLASYDFIGLTSSYENTFHVQSYFLCFNSSILQCVMDYFKTTGLPNNHGGAISLYELGMSTHLTKKGFSQFVFVSNNEMKKPFNTTCCKWEEVLNKTGIVKRQHFLKKYVIMAMKDIDISELAEKYAYNLHFIDFLKYHNVKLIQTK